MGRSLSELTLAIEAIASEAGPNKIAERLEEVFVAVEKHLSIIYVSSAKTPSGILDTVVDVIEAGLCQQTSVAHKMAFFDRFQSLVNVILRYEELLSPKSKVTLLRIMIGMMVGEIQFVSTKSKTNLQSAITKDEANARTIIGHAEFILGQLLDGLGCLETLSSFQIMCLFCFGLSYHRPSIRIQTPSEPLIIESVSPYPLSSCSFEKWNVFRMPQLALSPSFYIPDSQKQQVVTQFMSYFSELAHSYISSLVSMTDTEQSTTIHTRNINGLDGVTGLSVDSRRKCIGSTEFDGYEISTSHNSARVTFIKENIKREQQRNTSLSTFLRLTLHTSYELEHVKACLSTSPDVVVGIVESIKSLLYLTLPQSMECFARDQLMHEISVCLLNAKVCESLFSPPTTLRLTIAPLLKSAMEFNSLRLSPKAFFVQHRSNYMFLNGLGTILYYTHHDMLSMAQKTNTRPTDCTSTDNELVDATEHELSEQIIPCSLGETILGQIPKKYIESPLTLSGVCISNERLRVSTYANARLSAEALVLSLLSRGAFYKGFYDEFISSGLYTASVNTRGVFSQEATANLYKLHFSQTFLERRFVNTDVCKGAFRVIDMDSPGSLVALSYIVLSPLPELLRRPASVSKDEYLQRNLIFLTSLARLLSNVSVPLPTGNEDKPERFKMKGEGLEISSYMAKAISMQESFKFIIDLLVKLTEYIEIPYGHSILGPGPSATKNNMIINPQTRRVIIQSLFVVIKAREKLVERLKKWFVNNDSVSLAESMLYNNTGDPDNGTRELFGLAIESGRFQLKAFNVLLDHALKLGQFEPRVRKSFWGTEQMELHLVHYIVSHFASSNCPYTNPYVELYFNKLVVALKYQLETFCVVSSFGADSVQCSENSWDGANRGQRGPGDMGAGNDNRYSPLKSRMGDTSPSGNLGGSNLSMQRIQPGITSQLIFSSLVLLLVTKSNQVGSGSVTMRTNVLSEGNPFIWRTEDYETFLSQFYYHYQTMQTVKTNETKIQEPVRSNKDRAEDHLLGENKYISPTPFEFYREAVECNFLPHTKELAINSGQADNYFSFICSGFSGLAEFMMQDSAAIHPYIGLTSIIILSELMENRHIRSASVSNALVTIAREKGLDTVLTSFAHFSERYNRTLQTSSVIVNTHGTSDTRVTTTDIRFTGNDYFNELLSSGEPVDYILPAISVLGKRDDNEYTIEITTKKLGFEPLAMDEKITALQGIHYRQPETLMFIDDIELVLFQLIFDKLEDETKLEDTEGRVDTEGCSTAGDAITGSAITSLKNILAFCGTSLLSSDSTLSDFRSMFCAPDGNKSWDTSSQTLISIKNKPTSVQNKFSKLFRQFLFNYWILFFLKVHLTVYKGSLSEGVPSFSSLLKDIAKQFSMYNNTLHSLIKASCDDFNAINGVVTDMQRHNMISVLFLHHNTQDHIIKYMTSMRKKLLEVDGEKEFALNGINAEEFCGFMLLCLKFVPLTSTFSKSKIKTIKNERHIFQLMKKLHRAAIPFVRNKAFVSGFYGISNVETWDLRGYRFERMISGLLLQLLLLHIDMLNKVPPFAQTQTPKTLLMPKDPSGKRPEDNLVRAYVVQEKSIFYHVSLKTLNALRCLVTDLKATVNTDNIDSLWGSNTVLFLNRDDFVSIQEFFPSFANILNKESQVDSSLFKSLLKDGDQCQTHTTDNTNGREKKENDSVGFGSFYAKPGFLCVIKSLSYMYGLACSFSAILTSLGCILSPINNPSQGTHFNPSSSNNGNHALDTSNRSKQTSPREHYKEDNCVSTDDEVTESADQGVDMDFDFGDEELDNTKTCGFIIADDGLSQKTTGELWKSLTQKYSNMFQSVISSPVVELRKGVNNNCAINKSIISECNSIRTTLQRMEMFDFKCSFSHENTRSQGPKLPVDWCGLQTFKGVFKITMSLIMSEFSSTYVSSYIAHIISTAYQTMFKETSKVFDSATFLEGLYFVNEALSMDPNLFVSGKEIGRRETSRLSTPVRCFKDAVDTTKCDLIVNYSVKPNAKSLGIIQYLVTLLNTLANISSKARSIDVFAANSMGILVAVICVISMSLAVTTIPSSLALESFGILKKTMKHLSKTQQILTIALAVDLFVSLNVTSISRILKTNDTKKANRDANMSSLEESKFVVSLMSLIPAQLLKVYCKLSPSVVGTGLCLSRFVLPDMISWYLYVYHGPDIACDILKYTYGLSASFPNSFGTKMQQLSKEDLSEFANVASSFPTSLFNVPSLLVGTSSRHHATSPSLQEDAGEERRRKIPTNSSRTRPTETDSQSELNPQNEIDGEILPFAFGLMDGITGIQWGLSIVCLVTKECLREVVETRLEQFQMSGSWLNSYLKVTFDNADYNGERTNELVKNVLDNVSLKPGNLTLLIHHILASITNRTCVPPSSALLTPSKDRQIRKSKRQELVIDPFSNIWTFIDVVYRIIDSMYGSLTTIDKSMVATYRQPVSSIGLVLVELLSYISTSSIHFVGNFEETKPLNDFELRLDRVVGLVELFLKVSDVVYDKDAFKTCFEGTDIKANVTEETGIAFSHFHVLNQMIGILGHLHHVPFSGEFIRQILELFAKSNSSKLLFSTFECCLLKDEMKRKTQCATKPFLGPQVLLGVSQSQTPFGSVINEVVMEEIQREHRMPDTEYGIQDIINTKYLTPSMVNMVAMYIRTCCVMGYLVPPVVIESIVRYLCLFAKTKLEDANSDSNELAQCFNNIIVGIRELDTTDSNTMLQGGVNITSQPSSCRKALLRLRNAKQKQERETKSRIDKLVAKLLRLTEEAAVLTNTFMSCPINNTSVFDHKYNHSNFAMKAISLYKLNGTALRRIQRNVTGIHFSIQNLLSIRYGATGILSEEMGYSSKELLFCYSVADKNNSSRLLFDQISSTLTALYPTVEVTEFMFSESLETTGFNSLLNLNSQSLYSLSPLYVVPCLKFVDYSSAILSSYIDSGSKGFAAFEKSLRHLTAVARAAYCSHIYGSKIIFTSNIDVTDERETCNLDGSAVKRIFKSEQRFSDIPHITGDEHNDPPSEVVKNDEDEFGKYLLYGIDYLNDPYKVQVVSNIRSFASCGIILPNLCFNKKSQAAKSKLNTIKPIETYPKTQPASSEINGVRRYYDSGIQLADSNELFSNVNDNLLTVLFLSLALSDGDSQIAKICTSCARADAQEQGPTSLDASVERQLLRNEVVDVSSLIKSVNPFVVLMTNILINQKCFVFKPFAISNIISLLMTFNMFVFIEDRYNSSNMSSYKSFEPPAAKKQSVTTGAGMSLVDIKTNTLNTFGSNHPGSDTSKHQKPKTTKYVFIPHESLASFATHFIKTVVFSSVRFHSFNTTVVSMVLRYLEIYHFTYQLCIKGFFSSIQNNIFSCSVSPNELEGRTPSFLGEKVPLTKRVVNASLLANSIPLIPLPEYDNIFVSELTSCFYRQQDTVETNQGLNSSSIVELLASMACDVGEGNIAKLLYSIVQQQTGSPYTSYNEATKLFSSRAVSDIRTKLLATSNGSPTQYFGTQNHFTQSKTKNKTNESHNIRTAERCFNLPATLQYMFHKILFYYIGGTPLNLEYITNPARGRTNEHVIPILPDRWVKIDGTSSSKEITRRFKKWTLSNSIPLTMKLTRFAMEDCADNWNMYFDQVGDEDCDEHFGDDCDEEGGARTTIISNNDEEDIIVSESCTPTSTKTTQPKSGTAPKTPKTRKSDYVNAINTNLQSSLNSITTNTYTQPGSGDNNKNGNKVNGAENSTQNNIQICSYIIQMLFLVLTRRQNEDALGTKNFVVNTSFEEKRLRCTPEFIHNLAIKTLFGAEETEPLSFVVRYVMKNPVDLLHSGFQDSASAEGRGVLAKFPLARKFASLYPAGFPFSVINTCYIHDIGNILGINVLNSNRCWKPNNINGTIGPGIQQSGLLSYNNAASSPSISGFVKTMILKLSCSWDEALSAADVELHGLKTRGHREISYRNLDYDQCHTCERNQTPREDAKLRLLMSRILAGKGYSYLLDKVIGRNNFRMGELGISYEEDEMHDTRNEIAWREWYTLGRRTGNLFADGADFELDAMRVFPVGSSVGEPINKNECCTANIDIDRNYQIVPRMAQLSTSMNYVVLSVLRELGNIFLPAQQPPDMRTPDPMQSGNTREISLSSVSMKKLDNLIGFVEDELKRITSNRLNERKDVYSQVIHNCKTNNVLTSVSDVLSFLETLKKDLVFNRVTNTLSISHQHVSLLFEKWAKNPPMSECFPRITQASSVIEDRDTDYNIKINLMYEYITNALCSTLGGDIPSSIACIGSTITSCLAVVEQYSRFCNITHLNTTGERLKEKLSIFIQSFEKMTNSLDLLSTRSRGFDLSRRLKNKPFSDLSQPTPTVDDSEPFCINFDALPRDPSHSYGVRGKVTKSVGSNRENNKTSIPTTPQVTSTTEETTLRNKTPSFETTKTGTASTPTSHGLVGSTAKKNKDATLAMFYLELANTEHDKYLNLSKTLKGSDTKIRMQMVRDTILELTRRVPSSGGESTDSNTHKSSGQPQAQQNQQQQQQQQAINPIVLKELRTEVGTVNQFVTEIDNLVRARDNALVISIYYYLRFLEQNDDERESRGGHGLLARSRVMNIWTKLGKLYRNAALNQDGEEMQMADDIGTRVGGSSLLFSPGTSKQQRCSKAQSPSLVSSMSFTKQQQNQQDALRENISQLDLLREGIPRIEVVSNQIKLVRDSDNNLVRSHPHLEIVNPSVAAFNCINTLIFHFLTLGVSDTSPALGLGKPIPFKPPRISSHLFVLFLNQILSIMAIPNNGDVKSYRELVSNLHCLKAVGTKGQVGGKTEGKVARFGNSRNLSSFDVHKTLEASDMLRISTDINAYSNACEDFSSILFAFISILCLEHPIITLPKVVALTKITDIPDAYKKVASVNTNLVEAATFLLDFVRRDNVAMDDLVHLYGVVSKKYIELANEAIPRLTPSQMQHQTTFINSAMERASKVLKSMNRQFGGMKCPVLTIDIPVKRAVYENDVIQINRQYSNNSVELISKFSETLGKLGGINGSKRIQIFTSFGNIHEECLKKGRDDLRQSDILMSLFNIINSIFNTKDRSRPPLFMRTYTICPFSPSVGTLGMFRNTISFQSYLTDSSIDQHVGITTGITKDVVSSPIGFVSAYYRHKLPNMLLPEEFAKVMAIEQGKSLEEGFKAFVENIKRFPPVFRYFFLENFVGSEAYFGNIRRYTRSVAISSAVTELFGIGDRHSDNILIDTLNSDVLHIDLEIAFDTGRTLRIPEMCPCRLTQNMIDGFGVNSLSGSFLSIMEFIYEQVRLEKEIVISYCEVLLSDPLYKWSIPFGIRGKRAERDTTTSETNPVGGAALFSPENLLLGRGTANLVSPGNPEHAKGSKMSVKSGSNNNMKRAIQSIKSKLKGKIGSDHLSPLQYAEQRIFEAISNEHLGRMFVGWRPFL